MNNKYEAFMAGVNALKSEDMKKVCVHLIQRAQLYYSKYNLYNNILFIKKDLIKAYGTTEEETIDVKKGMPNELTPINQLYLEYYLKIFNHDNLSEKDKYILISNYKDEIQSMIDSLNGFSTDSLIPEIFEDKGIYKNSSNEKRKKIVQRVFKIMGASCKKASNKYIKSERIDIKPENASNKIHLYTHLSQYIKYSEEESFNKVFSESYVETLLNIMNTEEGLLPFMIAPVRTQLCYKKEGGRRMDSKSWRWCYNKDFRLTLDELDQKIERVVEPCKTLIENFNRHQKTLDTLLEAGIFIP